MYKKLIILFILLTPLLLSCGTKGSLYIPEEKYPQNESFNEQVDHNISNYHLS